MKSLLIVGMVSFLLSGCGSMKSFSVSGESIKVEGEVLPDSKVTTTEAKAAVQLAVDLLEKK